MPIFYPTPLHEGRPPTESGTPEPKAIDGRLDTSYDFTQGSDALLQDISQADGSVQDVSAIYIYTDNGVASPVALSENGGIVTPDNIVDFETFSLLQRQFRFWYTSLTGRAISIRTHFTRERSATTAKIYQVAILASPFLDIPNDGTFQRIELDDQQRGGIVHESLRGKHTVVQSINPSAKRSVAYRTRYQDKQLALDLKGLLEQYPHFFVEEDRVNFPERCYEGYLVDFTIRYTYSNTYRGSGFDTQFTIRER